MSISKFGNKYLQFLKKIRIPGYVRYILLLVITTRILLWVVMVLARLQTGIYSDFSDLGRAHEAFVLWDAGWYLNIVENGYTAAGISSGDSAVVGQANYAFFPLYPLLVAALGAVIGSDMFAGLIISNICFIVGLIFLYKLVRIDHSEDFAEMAIKVVVFFPTAFLFSALLSESLFFMLLMLVLYLARVGRWQLALIFAILLTATRSVGIFIVFPMFFEYLAQNGYDLNYLKFSSSKWRGFWKKENLRKLAKAFFQANILTLPLAWLGFFAFMLYIANLTGKLFAILNVQAEWGRENVNPVLVLFAYMIGDGANPLLVSTATLAILLLLIIFIRKIKIGYWIMGMVMILLPLSTSSMPFHILSMPRYLLLIFPLYFLLPSLLSKHKKLSELYTILAAMLQVYLAVQWTTGGTLVI